MKLEIQSLWHPTNQEWDMIWKKCPYATYFQSREWAEIWESHSHGKTRPTPQGLVFSDGIRVILPFSRESFYRGLGHRYVASPAGTFGGWLAEQHLDESHQGLIMAHILSNYRNLTWRNNPYEPTTVSTSCTKEEETFVLDLEGGFDQILHRWSRGHRSAANKAKNYGITIRQAYTEEDWRAYFQVYRDSLRRWGKNNNEAYPWHLFSTLFNRNSRNIKLWLAETEGYCIAGAICFYGGIHCVYWHGAALEKYFHMRPVNLLMHEAIKDACVRQIKWFDFNPSNGLTGVSEFKKRFGTIPLRCDLMTNESWEMRALTKAFIFLRQTATS